MRWIKFFLVRKGLEMGLGGEGKGRGGEGEGVGWELGELGEGKDDTFFFNFLKNRDGAG